MRTNIEEFRRFLKSDIWLDLKDQVNYYITNTQIELESCEIDKVERTRGKLSAYRALLELPETIIENLEDSDD
jgi:hypothetical protein